MNERILIFGEKDWAGFAANFLGNAGYDIRTVNPYLGATQLRAGIPIKRVAEDAEERQAPLPFDLVMHGYSDRTPDSRKRYEARPSLNEDLRLTQLIAGSGTSKMLIVSRSPDELQAVVRAMEEIKKEGTRVAYQTRLMNLVGDELVEQVREFLSQESKV